MIPELIATLCDHAQGKLRALMNMAGELLALAAQREAAQIDEKLFSELFATPAPTQAKVAGRRRLRRVSHSTSDLVGLSVLGDGARCVLAPNQWVGPSRLICAGS
jgi:hypothetical protein